MNKRFAGTTPASMCDLLMSPAEMFEFGFPLPFTVPDSEELDNPSFTFSKDFYSKVSDKRLASSCLF